MLAGKELPWKTNYFFVWRVNSMYYKFSVPLLMDDFGEIIFY